MLSRKRTRYYEADGTAVPAEEEEIWKRLTAEAEPSSAAKTDESFMITETFDSLQLAKVELQTLKDLFEKLDAQQGLGVTYIPDVRSPEEFRAQRQHEKLIKADQKRIQMKEAGEVLENIHAQLTQKVQKERTFYREIMGLSRFHKVRCEPTALSPFSVDLCLNTGSLSSGRVVELQADGDGHVILTEDVPKPAMSEVISMIEKVEAYQEQAQQESTNSEVNRSILLQEYKGRQKPEDKTSKQRSIVQPELQRKVIQVPEKAPVKLQPLERITSKNESEKELVIKKVMSIDFDTEDEELLVTGEETESESESDDLLESPPLEEDLTEKWFTREEMVSMTTVHMTLTSLEISNLWDLCKKTLYSQANATSMRPREHFHFMKAVEIMESNDKQPFGSLLRVDVLSFFVNCLYQLPPFLYQIDIRDLSLSDKEKIFLLSKMAAAENELESPMERDRLPTNQQEEQEWLKNLEPRQFYRWRFKETAPKLENLRWHFLELVDHEETLKQCVSTILEQSPGALVEFERTPGIHASQLLVEIKSKFRGYILVDAKQIYVNGLRTLRNVPITVSAKLQFSEFESWLLDVTSK